MPILGRTGFSIVEALLAIVVFAIGVLGATGTMALAWRAEMAGARAAIASRTASSLLDSLRTEVVHDGGRCDALSSGSSLMQRGTTVQWSTATSAGGREIWLSLSFASLASTATDTVWSFIPCR